MAVGHLVQHLIQAVPVPDGDVLSDPTVTSLHTPNSVTAVIIYSASTESSRPEMRGSAVLTGLGTPSLSLSASLIFGVRDSALHSPVQVLDLQDAYNCTSEIVNAQFGEKDLFSCFSS